MPPLFRIIRSAIIGLRLPLRPAVDEPPEKSTDACGIMRLPFSHRADFNREMNEQLDDSSRVLDDLDAKLLTLRTHVVSLRSQLAGSQSATEKTWDQIKSRLSKEQGELHDGVRQARHWTRSAPAGSR